jgi:hypothetical protein
MLVQHLLVLSLIVGMPLWDWYEIPRLKASPDPREKVRYYLKIVTAFWVLTVVAGLSTGHGICDSEDVRLDPVAGFGISRKCDPEGHHHRNVDCDPAAGATGSVQ